MHSTPATTRPSRTGAIGINLQSPLNYSRGFLYADAMRTAQPFPTADANGNPTADQTVLVQASPFATPTMAGTYKVRALGQCSFSPKSGAGTIANPAFDGTYSTADLVVTSAQLQALPALALQVYNTKQPLTSVEMWRPGATVGNLFYAPFVKLLAPFSTIRFMDLLATNGSTLVNWADRPTVGKRSFNDGRGIPYEHAFQLSAAAGNKDLWINVPVGATDDFINQFASLVCAQAPIGSTFRVYVEWSNEVWNSAMPQWKTNNAAALADATLKYDGMTDPNILMYRRIGAQCIKIAEAICTAYNKANIFDTPVRMVLAGQAEQPNVLRYALDYINTQVGPPSRYIYGTAIAPYDYFRDGFQITATTTADQIVAEFLANAVNANDANVMTNHGYADQYGLRKLAYEFGLDDGQGSVAVPAKIAAQYLPAVQDAIRAYLSKWAAGGGELACWFDLTYAAGANGQWGLMEDIYAPSTPKYLEVQRDAAVMYFNDAPVAVTPPTVPSTTPPPVEVPPAASFAINGVTYDIFPRK
jgi:hypothetical protein